MRCAANTKWRKNICSFSHFSIRHAAPDGKCKQTNICPKTDWARRILHVELIIFDYQINRIRSRTPIHHTIQAQSIESIFTHFRLCGGNSSRQSFIIMLSNRLIAASAEYRYDRIWEFGACGKPTNTIDQLIDREQFFKLNEWRLAHWNFRKMCFQGVYQTFIQSAVSVAVVGLVSHFVCGLRQSKSSGAFSVL